MQVEDIDHMEKEITSRVLNQNSDSVMHCFQDKLVYNANLGTDDPLIKFKNSIKSQPALNLQINPYKNSASARSQKQTPVNADWRSYLNSSKQKVNANTLSAESSFASNSNRRPQQSQTRPQSREHNHQPSAEFTTKHRNSSFLPGMSGKSNGMLKFQAKTLQSSVGGEESLSRNSSLDKSAEKIVNCFKTKVMERLTQEVPSMTESLVYDDPYKTARRTKNLWTAVE